MIKNYNQFINENANAQNALSIHEKINDPFTDFVERAKQRMENFTDHIAYLLDQIDKAIEDTLTEFEGVIVGEPNIVVSSDLSEVEVFIHTNIQNNKEAWETDESPAQDLEYRLYNWLDNYKSVSADINGDPDDDGNCVIRLRSYVIDSDHFDEFTDALAKFGER